MALAVGLVLGLMTRRAGAPGAQIFAVVSSRGAGRLTPHPDASG